MPTPEPGWNRRSGSLSAPYAGRRAISGAATWRSPSISRRPILSAEAAREPSARTGAGYSWALKVQAKWPIVGLAS
jgi:hypothetical protein